MNAISYCNGDTVITDFPTCSAKPLARMVQYVNDKLAGDDDEYLSPENSIKVLDLGWRTVGTGGDMSLDVLRAWLDELPADFTADPRNMVYLAVRRLDEEDMDAATDMALMVAEFFCDTVYHHGGVAELLQMVDRHITLWRELAVAFSELVDDFAIVVDEGVVTSAR